MIVIPIFDQQRMEQDECHIMLFTCDEGIDPRPEQCWVWWVTTTSASSGAVVSTKNREKTVSAEQTMITLLSIDVSIVLMLVKMISRKWLPSLVRCVLISRMCVWYQVSVIVELCYLSDNTRVPQSIIIVHWYWFESKFSEVLGWVWQLSQDLVMTCHSNISNLRSWEYCIFVLASASPTLYLDQLSQGSVRDTVYRCKLVFNCWTRTHL